MVSHRLRSISSVLGGKNSKEIAGSFRRGARLGAGWYLGHDVSVSHGTTHSQVHVDSATGGQV